MLYINKVYYDYIIVNLSPRDELHLQLPLGSKLCFLATSEVLVWFSSTISRANTFNIEWLKTLSLKDVDIISLLSDSDIFLGDRHSQPETLRQNKDKESLCEPETAFILQTRTQSDASRCGVDTGSDHNGSIFTAWTSLRLLDVWWCRMIKVIEKTTNVRVFA